MASRRARTTASTSTRRARAWSTASVSTNWCASAARWPTGASRSSSSINPSSLYFPSPLPLVTTPRTPAVKSAELKQSSVVLADTMSFADGRFLATLGLRDQTIEQESFSQTSGASTSRYKASATSPLVGLVFKPVQNVSVYANYTAGLTRGGTAGPGTANVGETFAPQKSKQYEAGVKVDWGRLTTQAAVYQIDPLQALRGANRPAVPVPDASAAFGTLLIAGATGALGQELLHRLAGSHRHAHVRVLVSEPMHDGLPGVE